MTTPTWLGPARDSAATGPGSSVCLAADCDPNTTLPQEPSTIPAPATRPGERAPGQPSPEAVAEVQEFLLDQLFEAFGLIASYATSAREAARRGDREEIRIRLRVDLRDEFRHAVALHDLLSPVPTKGGRR